MSGYALPAEFEERQVLETCRAGDEGGLELLYRRYSAALVQFCEHRLGTVGDAEDAAHETILKAHRAMPRFREGARLWPWLATIAANVCTDIQRSRERLSPEQEEAECLAPDLDEDIARRMRVSIADQALDELPERFRTPLFLREYMGWSYDDIARFSNKSIGSVRTTLMRARRAFQCRVEDVARRRGQWPLPAVVVGGRRRLRDVVRGWRDSLTRTGADTAGLLWRAEGILGLAPSLQMAAVAVVAVGTFAATPAIANDSSLLITPAASQRSVATEAAVGTVTAQRQAGAADIAATSTPGAPVARPIVQVTQSSAAIAPQAPPAHGTIDSHDGGGHMWVSVITVPGGNPVGLEQVQVGASIPCEDGDVGTTSCHAVRQGMQHRPTP